MQDPAAPAPDALPVTPAAATAAPSGSADELIHKGLALYWRHRYAQAAAEFEQATDADPQNAAAAWYLAYATYKVAEPKRPFDPGKQKAADLFAKAYAMDPNFKPDWGRAKP